MMPRAVLSLIPKPKRYYHVSISGAVFIVLVMYIRALDKNKLMRIPIGVLFDNNIVSRPENVHGDAPVHDYNQCLFLKFLSNQKQGLSSPKDLASYNCSHLMTLSKFSYGRLGNVMFQIASLIGIATWHGYTPVWPPVWKSLMYFELQNNVNFTLRNETREVRERVCCEHSQRFYHLNHTYNWTLEGYLQSWKYFKGVEDRVRETFTFKNEFKLNATTYLKSIANIDVLNVGVHVRHGDFNTLRGFRRGFSVAPLSYIKQAMQFFRHKLKTVQFIVVSDDIKWCKANLNDTDTYYSPFTDPGVDMALMSSCNHMIVTSGSFGWWGAWLAGGITVYYADFPRPGSHLETKFANNKTDYYPEHWIGMK